MAKIPRVSRNALIKYLIRKGFIPTMRKGSHVTMKKGSLMVTIPAGNSKMRIGLLLDILKKSMISRDEFIRDHEAGIVR